MATSLEMKYFILGYFYDLAFFLLLPLNLANVFLTGRNKENIQGKSIFIVMLQKILRAGKKSVCREIACRRKMSYSKVVLHAH